MATGSKPLETQDFLVSSANIVSLYYHISWFSYWYPSQWYRNGAWEYAYFPGYLLLSGAIFGFGWLLLNTARAIWRCLARIKKTVQLAEPPGNPLEQTQASKTAKEFLLISIILFASLVVLSFGPLLKWHNKVYSFQMPFYWLSSFVPGLSLVRAPGRFGMLIGLPLGSCLAFIIHKINLKQSYKTGLALILFVLLVIESWPKFSTRPFAPDPQSIYQQVSMFNPERKPLLELPVASMQPDQDIYQRAMSQLVGSTIHWSPLVSGYGLRFSKQMNRLLSLDWTLQNSNPNSWTYPRICKKIRGHFISRSPRSVFTPDR